MWIRKGSFDIRRGALVTVTAFVGTVIGSCCGYLFSQAQPDGLGYISMGAVIHPLPMAVVMTSCLIGALASAKFANRCEIKKLNRMVEIVLFAMGVVTILIKIFS